MMVSGNSTFGGDNSGVAAVLAGKNVTTIASTVGAFAALTDTGKVVSSKQKRLAGIACTRACGACFCLEALAGPGG
jgi:hypothetical protein